MTSLLGVGALLSTGHLGKPLRGLLAVRGIGRSALSNEVLALALALGATVAGLAIPVLTEAWEPYLGILGIVAGASSVGFLLALGALYNLPGQTSWRGLVVAQPWILGTTWGLLAVPAAGWNATGAVGLLILLPLLLMDGSLAVLRLGRARWAASAGTLAYPSFLPWGSRALGFRILLGLVLVPAFLLGGWVWGALGALTVALILDRVAFYTLAAKVTTESEVARVEGLL
jgi:DMSO reductase anchor subunit